MITSVFPVGYELELLGKLQLLHEPPSFELRIEMAFNSLAGGKDRENYRHSHPSNSLSASSRVSALNRNSPL